MVLAAEASKEGLPPVRVMGFLDAHSSTSLASLGSGGLWWNPPGVAPRVEPTGRINEKEPPAGNRRLSRTAWAWRAHDIPS